MLVAFQGWVREASPGQFHGGELMFGELGAVGSAGRCSASLAALPLRHSWYPLPTPPHIAGLIPGGLIPVGRALAPRGEPALQRMRSLQGCSSGARGPQREAPGAVTTQMRLWNVCP